MVKSMQKPKTAVRKYLREFVNCVIDKDFAKANANLTAAVNEKLRINMLAILQENS